MGRYKGRSQVACQNCHSSKLRCSGGVPCERCQNRGRECVYPVRDRLLTVPESYLRGLERQVNLSRQAVDERHSPHYRPQELTGRLGTTPPATTTAPAKDETRAPLSGTTTTPSSSTQAAVDGQSFEDCSAEGFVRKLRELSLTPDSSTNPLSHTTRPPSTYPSSNYTYSRLNFDVIQPDVKYNLPPQQYAFHLLSVFEEGFCDYHWYLRKRFHERLIQTYANPNSQSWDRSWLCRVSVVLALAETWNRGRAAPDEPCPPLAGQYVKSTADPLGGGGLAGVPLTSQPRLPPGSEFFEQGLLLLKLSLEEPVIEDVEALNLVAFYCYSLNRRNSAYFYASQSISLAKLLSLDKPEQSAHESRIAQEHRIRVWWTSYCMNRMVSTELGIPPTHEPASRDLKLPSSAHLTPQELEEFFDPSLLTAQTQLCQIKFRVVETASHHLRMSADGKPLEVLGPCLTTLQEWRQHLTGGMSFTFDRGIPKEMLDLPACRILASLYLRYHQCFILLLRSFFLQDLSFHVQNYKRQAEEPHMTPLNPPLSSMDSDLVSMKLQCLNAARNNCKILIGLWRCGKIAKYGYWESLHLFSGLSIVLLSKVAFTDMATGFYAAAGTNAGGFPTHDDAELYAVARRLLEDMAQLGNPASKDHVALLTDVEQLVDTVTHRRHSSSPSGGGAQQRDPSQAGGGGILVPTGGVHQSVVSAVSAGQHWLETMGTDDGIPFDQFWQDIEWENMLSNCTRVAPHHS